MIDEQEFLDILNSPVRSRSDLQAIFQSCDRSGSPLDHGTCSRMVPEPKDAFQLMFICFVDEIIVQFLLFCLLLRLNGTSSIYAS